jgi:hypothetical protein
MIILLEGLSDIQMEISIQEICTMEKDKAKDHIFAYRKTKDTRVSGKMISKMEKVKHILTLGSIVFSNGD